MASSKRCQRIRTKYEEDQTHIQYLLSRGWHSFKIADHMTENMITLLREGIRQRFLEWTDNQILQEMRRILLLNNRIQRKRGLRQNG